MLEPHQAYLKADALASGNNFDKHPMGITMISEFEEYWCFTTYNPVGHKVASTLLVDGAENVIYKWDGNARYEWVQNLNDFRSISWVSRISQTWVIFGILMDTYKLDLTDNKVYALYSHRGGCLSHTEMWHMDYGQVYLCFNGSTFSVIKYEPNTGKRTLDKKCTNNDPGHRFPQGKDAFLIRNSFDYQNFIFTFNVGEIQRNKAGEGVIKMHIWNIKAYATPEIFLVRKGAIWIGMAHKVLDVVVVKNYIAVAVQGSKDGATLVEPFYIFVYNIAKDFQMKYYREIR
jgi:hypothetical protein